MNTRLIYTGFFLLLCISGIDAQTRYTIDNTVSEITIEGTSNVHDWEMKASGFISYLYLDFESETLSEILQAELHVPADNINSHNSIMDSKTRKAIKADTYDQISFNLKNITGFKNAGNSISGTANGTLRIAGTANQVAIPFSGNVIGKEKIMITGTEVIKLKEFNIDPPTAMMNTLKTGELVDIHFRLQFNSTGEKGRAISSR